jgi:hypothetical protein
MKFPTATVAFVLLTLASLRDLHGEGDWEITPASEQALQRGLDWLANNQGPEGNWTSNDLGLVSLGAMAFMASGHTPGRGRYGSTVQRALDYVLDHAKPSGLLNIAQDQHEMYNHGLATFVLGQAHGMTPGRDRRLNRALDRALRLIASVQCEDGGWGYQALRQHSGHDLSLVVMQAKALRSAMDSGLEVQPAVVDMAIRSVREHYGQCRGRRGSPNAGQVREQFIYTKGGNEGSVAMAAAGVVCLQEFGQYDDWRIPPNIEVILDEIRAVQKKRQADMARNARSSQSHDGTMPFDAYTLYYVGQALYQVGGPAWEESYPILRDYLVSSQVISVDDPVRHGHWMDRGCMAGGRIPSKPGDLFGTAVACFILAIPNRYLPILQEGKIESLRRTTRSDR